MAYPGRIYRIVGGDKVYYGSTTLSLPDRWKYHKSKYNTDKKGQCSSKKLFEEFGIDNCIIELIEECPNTNSREELETIETFYITTNECVNIKIKRTRQQYRQDMKEEQRAYLQERRKQLKNENKDTFECECGSTVKNYNKARHLKTDKHTACL